MTKLHLRSNPEPPHNPRTEAQKLLTNLKTAERDLGTAMAALEAMIVIVEAGGEIDEKLQWGAADAAKRASKKIDKLFGFVD